LLWRGLKKNEFYFFKKIKSMEIISSEQIRKMCDNNIIGIIGRPENFLASHLDVLGYCKIDIWTLQMVNLKLSERYVITNISTREEVNFVKNLGGFIVKISEEEVEYDMLV
jgi:hypothetical protein